MQQSVLDSTTDWRRAASLRFVELDLAARRSGVTFSAYERACLVSLSLIEDARRAIAVAVLVRLEAESSR
jgi:hypothetical protein